MLYKDLCILTFDWMVYGA